MIGRLHYFTNQSKSLKTANLPKGVKTNLDNIELKSVYHFYSLIWFDVALGMKPLIVIE